MGIRHKHPPGTLDTLAGNQNERFTVYEWWKCSTIPDDLNTTKDAIKLQTVRDMVPQSQTEHQKTAFCKPMKITWIQMRSQNKARIQSKLGPFNGHQWTISLAE